MTSMKSKVSEAFYQSLFDNTLDGLAYCQMFFDAQGNPVDFMYIEVNKNFEKLTGLKDAMGKKITELVPGIQTSNPELFEIYGRVSLTGKPEKFETYVNQLSRWFLVSVYSPKKGFFTAVFQNTTERKQAEKDLENAKIAARNVLSDLQKEREKLAEAKAKDEAIFASIGDGLVFVDKDMKTMLINRAAEVATGWSSPEILGKLWSDVVENSTEAGKLVPPDEGPLHSVLLKRKTIATDSTDLTNTYVYTRKDKTKFPVAITVSPVNVEGKLIGAILVFRDITHEQAIDKAKTEFISLASHQLRTPLTTVSWYAEMLLAKDIGEIAQEQKKYLDEVYSGSQRMILLVNALLNVARIELGTFMVELKPTDVIKVVQSEVGVQKPQIDAKKLKFSSSFGKDIPIIQADPKLLGMIVQNLLSNAVKYTPEGGKINMEVSLEDKKNILLKISDTGYGIPKNQQSQIFDKLFRADNVRAKDTEGTGLGLYIVKSIIDNSNGKIRFESQENKGTTFYVTLPLSGMKKKEGAVALTH